MARRPKIYLDIAPEVYVAAACMLMLVPFKWLCAWFVAAAVHECCHCVALLLCHAPMKQIRINLNGAVIKTIPLKSSQQLLCTLAGPFGALLLLLLSSIFPRLAICAFIQSVYNLIPVLPLDGGHALQCVLAKFLSESQTERIMIFTQRIILSGMILLGIVFALFFDFGLLPAVLAAFLLLRIRKIKIPCKTMVHRVQ